MEAQSVLDRRQQPFLSTPLGAAIIKGDANALRTLLLTHAAEIDKCLGDLVTTPLQLSVSRGDVECARVLIEARAQLDLITHDSKSNQSARVR